MKYRSRTEIVAEILGASRKPATKTRIMYDAYLSHAQLKEYLEVLKANGLLLHDEKNRLYRTATKGLNFLESYQQMGELMLDGQDRTECDADFPAVDYTTCAQKREAGVLRSGP